MVVYRTYQVSTTGFSKAVYYLTTLDIGKRDVGTGVAGFSELILLYFITYFIVLTQ